MVSHLDLLNLNIENFRPYLQNDETLGEKDTVELHFLLQKLEKQRKEIDRTIDVVSLTIDTLHRSHDELNETIFSYKSLVSPIRNIPEDVLGEIFTYTLPTTRNAFPIATETPLLLTSICKHWGKVAYSTPRLWSKLHVVLPSYETEDLWRHWYLSTIKRFLGLSGSVPLSLSITYSRGLYNGSCRAEAEAEALLLPLIQQSHRWCDIEITCNPETLQYIDERIVKGPTGAISLPLLRRLRVRPIRRPIRDDIVVNFNLLYAYSMPSLQELSLDLSHYQSSPSFPISKLQEAPYWQSLTRLSIQSFGYEVQLFGFLHRCEELRELLLGISSCYQLTNFAPVCLPKLTKLTLQGVNARNSSFYGYLETPLLTRLSLYPNTLSLLDGGEGEAIHKRPLVQDFVAQCRNLQTLVISPRNMSAGVIRSVFEADPGITTLILDSSEVLLRAAQLHPTPPSTYGQPYNLMEVFVLLTNTSTQSASRPLLSNLKSCSILHAPINKADADVILAFCKSRMLRHTPTSALTGNHHPVASLDHIQMVLMKETGIVDVRKELLEYAESIGRRVGEDIIIDITYPWGDSIEWTTPLNPQRDLNPNTDCTWDKVDA